MGPGDPRGITLEQGHQLDEQSQLTGETIDRIKLVTRNAEIQPSQRRNDLISLDEEFTE